MTAPPRPTGGRRWIAAVVLVHVLLLGALLGGLAMHRRDPWVTLTAEAVSVRGGMYSATVPLTAITAVSLERELPAVEQRTNGFSLGGTRRGHFRLEDLGAGQLFVDLERPPFVLVRTADGFVAVNSEDPVQTRAWFEELIARHP